MKRIGLLLIVPGAIMLTGCIAKTAIDVATAPVRAASQAADWATTSQDEADRSNGREIRRREARLAELESDYDDLARSCDTGNDRACREAVAVRREMEELIPTIPVESD